jgi:hypothetical protein
MFFYLIQTRIPHCLANNHFNYTGIGKKIKALTQQMHRNCRFSLTEGEDHGGGRHYQYRAI